VTRSSEDLQRQRLCALLRQVRVDAGMRQSDIAEQLGKPQSFVSKYESGARRLDLIELRNLCAVLGITVEKLVKRFEAELR
jgi:transcriptional regulator with XRE-family HTH domain